MDNQTPRHLAGHILEKRLLCKSVEVRPVDGFLVLLDSAKNNVQIKRIVDFAHVYESAHPDSIVGDQWAEISKKVSEVMF